MKKIISAIVLALTLLCSSLPVMAAEVDVKPQSVIDPLAIATGAVPLDLKGNREALKDYRFDAKDLRYELRNGSNTIVKSGNLGDLAESTSMFIIDWYTTYNSKVSIPCGYQFVIYPEGEEGFTIGYNQMYFAYCEFGYSDAVGLMLMEAVCGNDSANVWSESFTGSHNTIHYGEYSDQRVKYRLRIINGAPKDMSVMRLNFVTYDYYQQ